MDKHEITKNKDDENKTFVIDIFGSKVNMIFMAAIILLIIVFVLLQFYRYKLIGQSLTKGNDIAALILASPELSTVINSIMF